MEVAAPSSCHTNPCLNLWCACPTGLFLTPKLSHAFWSSVPPSFHPPQPSSLPTTMFAFANGSSDSLSFCPLPTASPLPLEPKAGTEMLREHYNIYFCDRLFLEFWIQNCNATGKSVSFTSYSLFSTMFHANSWILCQSYEWSQRKSTCVQAAYCMSVWCAWCEFDPESTSKWNVHLWVQFS